MFNVENKVVVVTGAAQGNGEAIAMGLSKLGATVILADLNEEKLNLVKEQIATFNPKVYAFKLNVASYDSCLNFSQQVKSEVGDIDILVNNAGILRRSTIESETTFKDLDDTLNVNVKGSYYLINTLLDSLKKTKGNIVNVASIQSFVAATSATTYAISKGAVAQMTKTLAAELAKYGVRVNAIAPGVIETHMTEVTRSNKDMLEGYLKHVPMNRMGQPTELVGPISFLCSDAASYVTGCILPVDGGYLTI